MFLLSDCLSDHVSCPVGLHCNDVAPLEMVARATKVRLKLYKTDLPFNT